MTSKSFNTLRRGHENTSSYTNENILNSKQSYRSIKRVHITNQNSIATPAQFRFVVLLCVPSEIDVN